MPKWAWIVGGCLVAAGLILVVPGGIPLVIGAAKKLRDQQREKELAAAREAAKFQH